jgi:hypothetical protein
MNENEKPTAKYKQVTVHLRQEDLDQLDEWAAEATTTRSAMLRKMVDERQANKK